MTTGATPSLSDRFSMILDGLHRAVAARVAGGAMAVALIWLVCGRVRLVERRILGLLARFRAGRLGVRVGRSGGGGGRGRVAGTQRLSGRFGWLLPMVPCAAAGFGSQLRHLLEEPEMRGLLAQSRQARLVLAPLCRMLGIEAALLMAGVAAAVVAPVEAKVVAKRVRKVRAKVDWGRIPLPRGVLAAARRQGFGKA
jgi:hypothetical protein